MSYMLGARGLCGRIRETLSFQVYIHQRGNSTVIFPNPVPKNAGQYIIEIYIPSTPTPEEGGQEVKTNPDQEGTMIVDRHRLLR